MTEGLVTVAVFVDRLLAHVAKTKLQSEGIEAMVADDEIVSAFWFYSHAVGGVKVRVKKEDEERARAILDVKDPEAHPVSGQWKPKEFSPCSQCQSNNVVFIQRPRIVVIFFFLLFFLPLPIFNRRWKCNDCGHYWRERHPFSAIKAR